MTLKNGELIDQKKDSDSRKKAQNSQRERRATSVQSREPSNCQSAERHSFCVFSRLFAARNLSGRKKAQNPQGFLLITSYPSFVTSFSFQRFKFSAFSIMNFLLDSRHPPAFPDR
jgi:hypothetical protein